MISNDGWHEEYELTSKDIILNRIKAGLWVSRKDIKKVKSNSRNNINKKSISKAKQAIQSITQQDNI